MERPSRSRKPVNYSDNKEFDDDEDFAYVKAPPNKKARVSGKEPEWEKTIKSASKTTSQEASTLPSNRKERLPLDDKLYARDLEAALTLSMLRTPEAGEELSPNDKGGEDQPLSKAESASLSPLLSNCSVDISLLGLDKITGERGAPCRPRQAVSKAAESQRSLQQEESGSGRDEDYQPTCTPDSESDAGSSGEDESDDEEFTVKKAEKKKPKKAEKTKKEKTASPPALQKQKKTSKSPKSKLEAAASPVGRRPVSIPRKPASSPPASRPPASSPPVSSPPASRPPASRPAVSLSPAGGKLPKWTPPAQIGRSPGASQSIQVKSPGQGLRLGLSRLARVKPLHPSAAGH
ncbi:RAD51-associated protein 1 isoform X1 [Conger conger]|uniref:RAD51-associated protein 1 isoform X1 n=1 Tax=Conger conger TaxID=82655 RepID=UPI002A5A0870|nr:RAD51-associated protein 1 isoform X1 [Conger conger]